MEKELEAWYTLHKFHFYMGQYQTKDLADYLGVSSKTIQRWLKSQSKPGKEQLAKISQYVTTQAKRNQPE